MKKIFILFFCFINLNLHSKENLNENSVLKIHVVISRPDYNEPWNLKSSHGASGSGSIIEGKKIITNAHVVADAKFIQVSKRENPTKYNAYVQFIAHEYDLAILKVEDETFFNNTIPIEFGELPELRDKVITLGYPMGGEILSITEGVVSRIEHRLYVHANTYFMACQTDASINPGNSGGPVLKDGKMVGVAFQGGSGENIGYFIPNPVINHFLNDIKDGVYNGVPSLGVEIQTMESPTLRKYYGLNNGEMGVLAIYIAPNSSAINYIQPNDVLTKIDDKLINEDGTIEFRSSERTFFGYVLNNHKIGDILKVEIIRNKKKLQVEIPLKPQSEVKKNVNKVEYDVYPTYYIFGGLVFQPLTENYLQIWGNWRVHAPNELVYLFYKRPTNEIDNYPILTKVLANKNSVGYEKENNLIIQKVNGIIVKSFVEMVKIIENNKEEYLVFEDDSNQKIVLDYKEVKNNQDEILKTYLIDKRMSNNIEKILKK